MFKNLGCFSSRSKTFWPYLRNGCPIDVKQKGSASVEYWVQYVTLTFLPHSWPWPWIFLGQISKELYLRNCLSDWCEWKGSESIGYWADYMTLPFDHIHDLDFGVSRSEFEIALPHEWNVRLTRNKNEVSHPFMTLILISVIMVDGRIVPDTDQGDLRRRRAVDISG